MNIYYQPIIEALSCSWFDCYHKRGGYSFLSLNELCTAMVCSGQLRGRGPAAAAATPPNAHLLSLLHCFSLLDLFVPWRNEVNICESSSSTRLPLIASGQV